MNEAPELLQIDNIVANPFQVRQAEDPTAIAELAANIEKNGLLQPPTVRLRNHYELAFGHTRVAAFRLLADQGKDEYKLMPCTVKDLDDLQMFEMAISENLQRRDLNPVEIAAAEQRYMKEFNKTSQEAADFFGKSATTIRGDVRLLDLPEVAKEKLASGEMTVGVARQLLTIQRVSGQKAADKMAKKLATDDIDTEHIVGQELMKSGDSVQMWNAWRSDESPRAGLGLWLLGTPPKKLPNDYLHVLTKEKAAEALGMEIDPDHKAEILNKLNSQIYELYYQDGSAPERAQKLIADGAPENDIDRLAQLIDPPACSNCSFYAKVEKSHYCGFATCHARKIAAYSQGELTKLVKKMDILAYDPAADGKGIFALDAGYGRDTYKKIFEDRTDIRLQAAYTSQQKNYGTKHDHTDSYVVRVIAVGETAKKLIEKRRKDNAERNAPSDTSERDRQWKIDAENRKASEKLLDLAAPIFAPAFKDLGIAPMLALLGGGKRKDKAETLRLELAKRCLGTEAPWQIKERGPVACGKHLQGVAKTWGIDLPSNWQEMAQGLTEGLREYKSLDGKKVVVSAETEAA